MFSSRRLLQRWCFSVFLLCSPVPHFGRPIDAPSRTRRSVTHAQLMHDKGRTLQDFKRRMWLQELLDEVHTAAVRDLPGGAVLNPSTTGSTLHSKPPGGTKHLPVGFGPEEEVGGGRTNLPQETNEYQVYKDGAPRAPGKKKKKGRSGRRREGDKRKRRARSAGRREEEEEEEEGGSGGLPPL
ncbi:parathyroid hormone-like hormone a [Pungitius pungitius]|uniref:parathyroid hormone-like hormone a n=1 Tax=Pungitius pungitius TaxID=134920 RepID=UPI0018891CBA|nr:parathyroid hormone-like hormone a [Pungitius pungitius]XP_037315562.1 parathyroid hormone-like hormone a [Pungitius pungitius]